MCVCSDAKSGLTSVHVDLSLSLNAGALLLRPESLSVRGGVHALPQSLLHLGEPLRRLPHGFLGS